MSNHDAKPSDIGRETDARGSGFDPWSPEAIRRQREAVESDTPPSRFWQPFPPAGLSEEAEGEATAVQPGIRTFATGANRNAAEGKYDFEGFLSPLVVTRFGQYMNKHRYLADGTLRDSDNWQKGLPRDVYIKSAWRHFVDWWATHRDVGEFNEFENEDEDTLCALMFNTMGYLHEILKERGYEARTHE